MKVSSIIIANSIPNAQKRIILNFVSTIVERTGSLDSIGIKTRKEFAGIVLSGSIIIDLYDNDNCETVYQIKSKNLRKQNLYLFPK